MKPQIFLAGKVGPLPAYLGYFFLRFPGRIGPEETWPLEFLDTYDQRWGREGRVWARRGDKVILVSPPSLLAEEAAFNFGFSKPLLWGRGVVKVRSVTFDGADGNTLAGQLVRARSKVYLILAGKSEGPWAALFQALEADGLVSVSSLGLETLAAPLRKPFQGPSARPDLDPNESAASFLVNRAREGLTVARQYEKGIHEDLDTECLHQQRVLLRKVRSYLSLGSHWKEDPSWMQAKRLFRELMQKTNELRDLDVLLLDASSLRALVPWGEGDRLADWEAAIRSRRSMEFTNMTLWMKSPGCKTLLSEIDALWEVLLIRNSEWTVAEMARASFKKTARTLKGLLATLGPEVPDETLHRARIEAKKLRYSLEIFGALVPAEILLDLQKVLRQTQDGLGRFQDRSLLLLRLRAEIEEVRKGTSKIEPLSYGILLGVLASDHRQEKVRALKAAHVLGSGTFRRNLVRLAHEN